MKVRYLKDSLAEKLKVGDEFSNCAITPDGTAHFHIGKVEAIKNGHLEVRWSRQDKPFGNDDLVRLEKMTTIKPDPAMVKSIERTLKEDTSYRVAVNFLSSVGSWVYGHKSEEEILYFKKRLVEENLRNHFIALVEYIYARRREIIPELEEKDAEDDAEDYALEEEDEDNED